MSQPHANEMVVISQQEQVSVSEEKQEVEPSSNEEYSVMKMRGAASLRASI